VLPILARREGAWIVTRSFSKAYGLAGARVGYGITSSEALADTYRKLRTNFSVNAVALAGARAALDDEEYLARMLDHVAAQRERLAAALTPHGFIALPSAANFLALLTPRPAADLAAALRADNIYVVTMPAPGPQGGLRISIGTAEDTEAVIASLTRALSA
jgi:histidinol-phosphate aminotransferase